ncbi:N-acetylmuramoyl-L-alanine amidase [Cyanobacteria bacterium FACHB-63]|nr:N-acetylmuramoyl-L-alanine amidase [Cyanobacteria bacterium FACHB-63]
MTALIRANRPEVSRQFPVLGFTIRTGVSPSWVEVAIATDPKLFYGAEAKAKRTPNNFYSSRTVGLLPAERGEVVYLVPPEVIARFAGQTKIYYALAVYPQGDFRNPQIARLSPEMMPYVQLSSSFTGARRSLMDSPNRAGGLTGRGSGYVQSSQAALEWGGDMAMPGEMAPIAPPSQVAPSPAATAPHNGHTPLASATPAPTMQGFIYKDYTDGYEERYGPVESRSQAAESETSNEDAQHGIEGPIPDSLGSIAQGLVYSHPLSISPEYPQASRFEPAASSNYRVSPTARTINRIIIHITDGGANIAGPISWFKNPSARVSAHYIVGQDGEVVQMVPHNDVAWHAGSANGDSIGIEHVANTRGLNPTEAEYCASAALVNWLCQQYSIPMDRTHILGHAEADPHTSHRSCPNAVWNWDYFMGLVTSGSCYPMSIAAGFSYASAQRTLATPLSTEIPLDPGQGGRSIAESALKIGDIILSTTNSWISDAIRQVTQAPISHAMIYIGNDQVVEAIGSGVTLRSLTEAVSGATVAVAFRVPGLTSEQGLRVRDFVGRQLDRSYSYWGIVRQALFQLDRAVWCDGKSGEEYDRCIRWIGRVNLGTDSNDTFFCSQLVLAAYADAGVPLTSSPPNWNSPGDLADLRFSGRLGYVGHLKAEVAASQSFSVNNFGVSNFGVNNGYRNGNGSRYTAVRPLAQQSFDVQWSDVQLVPQLTDMSCWAAAAAMVVGWRDRISIDPTEIAQGAGQWAAYTAGLNPADVPSLAQAWQLVMEPPQSYTVEGLRQLLERNGPLWVTAAVPTLHAIVVTGMYGDSTVDQTYVRIKDPWGRASGTPGAPGNYNPTPGQGSEYVLTLQQFVQEYEGAATNPSAVNIQVLHAGGRSQASSSQSLRSMQFGVAAQSYSRALAGSPLPTDGIERMRQEFVSNAAAGSARRNCITITNAGLRQLYGNALKNPDGSNKALGSTIQGTMAALRQYGLTPEGTVFEFLDASGKLTKGVIRPDRLQTSIESWLLNQAQANQASGWYAFGLSIMDGYHSVVLALSFNGIGDSATRLFWADQIYSGWDNVTGQLDARITERTQTWWDPLPVDRKARTRVTLWQLLPGTSLTQGLSYSSRGLTTAPELADDTEGIEGYEEEVYVNSQGLSLTCSDAFCPTNAASTASSAHFSLSEFTSRDGTVVPEQFRGNIQQVMDNLEVLRHELGDRPLRIISGYRSCTQNTRVEGAEKSRHLCGQAADIQVEGVDPGIVHSTIERLIAAGRMQQGGLGLYDTFVHYDVRGRRARWDRRRRTATVARSFSDPGEVTPNYAQANSTFDALRMFFDWLRRQLKFRTGVPNTTFFPHSAIAKLYGTDASGNRILEGTGFYVGRNKIVTAAHVLWFNNTTRAVGVEVIPGLNGTNMPFGGASVGSSGFTIHHHYNPASYDPNTDIAVITSAPDAPNGQFFEMEELRMSPNTGMITCGYAAVGVDPTLQHLDVDTIRQVQNGTFTYAAQVRQGSSGGPVFYALDENTIRVVGLNVTTYNAQENRGLRLTDPLIQWINNL